SKSVRTLSAVSLGENFVGVFLFSEYNFRSLFFFFQAEDGIRDFHVTGVQTCALPICASTSSPVPCSGTPCFSACSFARSTLMSRSEERRVGKECRSRQSTYH